MIAVALLLATIATARPAAVPAPASPPALDTAVFAGGCFWGVDAVFRHVRGVAKVVSGYAGGSAATAHYLLVSTSTTGHAESVQVTYDPAQVSYEELLQVFFTVAHDPTQLNRQGPDEGTQYRSVIFYTSPEQRRAAAIYIATLTRTHAYQAPIVTEIVKLERFYPAEEYHQNYLARHPDQPYIVYNDLPKVRRLQVELPELYRP